MTGRERRQLRATLFLVLALPMSAEAQSSGAGAGVRRMLDATVERHQVSKDLGDWSGAGLKLVYPVWAGRTVWYGEALWRRAFHDEGAYGVLGVQQSLASNWLAFVSVSGGSGDFIFPDVRVDASLSRKWLASQRVVTTAGATMVDAKRGYRDAGGFLELAAYVGRGAVIEAGARGNRSQPGDVTSARAFGAVTLGTQGTRFVTLRGSTGTEGYQQLAPGTVITKFRSHEGSATWREWLGGGWGALVQGEYYTNSFYRRTGATIGLFLSW